MTFLLSCSPGMNPDNYIERGTRNVFQIGHPEFYISAYGIYEEQNNSIIRLFMDVVRNSLITKSTNNGQSASADAFVNIRRVDDEDGQTLSDSFSIKLSNYEESNQQRRYYNIIKQYDVEPGMYNIEVTLKDNSSKNTTTVATQTFIPSQAGTEPHLTNIQLFGLDIEEGEGYMPITTYDIPARYDSLKFVYQVTNNRSDSGLRVNSTLEKFKSDTSPARTMGNANYSSSSIQYKGIDYDESTTFQTNRRTLFQEGSVLIEYKLASIERGNYRFRVYLNSKTSEDELESATRDFGIKSEHYPSVKTPRELARPLYYLMSENEYEELLSLESDSAIKNSMDRFWLQHIGDKEKARQVIDHYYSRVESANKLFSNFKEGWKTDRGMMYILFGPPLYKNKTLNTLEWFYSYDRSNPRKRFAFERPKSVNRHYPFNNYLLQRKFGYNNIEYKQRRLWLKGLILEIPI